MSAASRYWLLVRLDAAGRRKTQEIVTAKAFFSSAFPEFANATDVPDAQIQHQLLHLWRTSDRQHPAQLCLRCYISSLIEQAVTQLETNFGSNHGFTRYDLFPLVLNDIIVERPVMQVQGKLPPISYTSLAQEILQTFDPGRSSLSNWTYKLVKQNRSLKTFLIQHGIYLVTDWAILNDTDPEQLQRVLSEFHHLSSFEIAQAIVLLENYHTIYRRDRRAARKAGSMGQCPLPTTEQLQQISYGFHQKTNLTLSASEVMTRLQDIAELLRQYRIYIRGGSLPSESLACPTEGEKNQTSVVLKLSYTDKAEDEQAELLQFYRQQFMQALDLAIASVISHRLSYLQHQNPPLNAQFTTALQLFHCQGQSMGEIASQIGLQAQYQVTRLLKLKQFRAEVRQLMLKSLLPSILEKAITYTNIESATNLEQQVESVLNEQVDAMIQEAESESIVIKRRPLTSLFSRRVCRCLDRFKNEM